MVETRDHFVRRLNLLGRKHAQMANGYSTSVGRNGVIVVKPKRKPMSFPIKGIVLLVVSFFAFKAFMLAVVGPVTYNERLSKLERGTVIEQYGAKAFGIDPVTAALADFTGPMMR